MYSRSCERSLHQEIGVFSRCAITQQSATLASALGMQMRTSPPFMYYQCIMLHPFDSRGSSISAASKVLVTQVRHAMLQSLQPCTPFDANKAANTCEACRVSSCNIQRYARIESRSAYLPVETREGSLVCFLKASFFSDPLSGVQPVGPVT